MNIANKPVVYKDFSGEIKWKWTACVVRNADFEILKKEDDYGNEIVFDDAVFVSGDIYWGDVKNGLNLGCDFYNCRIEYMINKGGKIYNCNWRDGIFEGGTFRHSTWYGGIWIKGIWDDGRNSSGKLMESTPDNWKE